MTASTRVLMRRITFCGMACAVLCGNSVAQMPTATEPARQTLVKPDPASVKNNAPEPKSARAGADKATPSKPVWAELTTAQQQALQPLAASWDSGVNRISGVSGISEAQKRKWLALSENYSTLTPEQRAVMHSRMNEWLALSPQARAQARLNFARTNELSRELTPDEKNAKWQAYQALSPEQKSSLAAQASPKPTGAATAVKPVPPQKLVAVPTSK